MALPLTINGVVFEYPQNFDEGWGINATGWAQAVTNGMLQRAGGNFPLLAEVDFGASFGLKAIYYKTRSANPASVGTIRLASADPGVVFRNNANSGDLVLTTNASDQLLYNGNPIATGGGGAVTSITGTTSQIIASSPTGAVTLSTPQNIATTSSPTFASVTHTSNLILKDSVLANLTVEAPTTLSTPWTFKYPINPGSNGQVLSTDGSGGTSWINAAGGGTVNSGTAGQIGYYATSSTTISGSPTLSDSGQILLYTQGLGSVATEFHIFQTGSGAAKILFQGNGFQNKITSDNLGNFQILDVDNSRNILNYTRSSHTTDMGGSEITSIANATSSTSATAFGQVQYGFQPAIQFTNIGSFSATTGAFEITAVTTSITPTSASSRIKITVSGSVNGNGSFGYVSLSRGGAEITGAKGFVEINGNITAPVGFSYIDSPASTSSQTYAIVVKKAGSANISWNPDGLTCIMILEELR